MNLGNKNENVIYENWNSIAFHVCGMYVTRPPTTTTLDTLPRLTDSATHAINLSIGITHTRGKAI